MHYKNNFFYKVLFNYPQFFPYQDFLIQTKENKPINDVKLNIIYEKDDILRSEKWNNKFQEKNKSLDITWKEKKVLDIKKNTFMYDEAEIGWPVFFFFVSSVGIGIGFGIGYNFYYK